MIVPSAKRLRLAEDRAYVLEFCKCGQHPRIMSVAALVRAWKIGRAKQLAKR